MASTYLASLITPSWGGNSNKKNQIKVLTAY